MATSNQEKVGFLLQRKKERKSRCTIHKSLLLWHTVIKAIPRFICGIVISLWSFYTVASFGPEKYKTLEQLLFFVFFCQRNAVQDFQGTLFLVQKLLPSNSFNVASPSNSTFASVLLQILRGNIVYNSVSKREHFCNGVTVDNNPDAIQGIP